MSLLPHEAVMSCSVGPMGAIPSLPVWVLAAISTWLVPSAVASNDHGLGSDHDDGESSTEHVEGSEPMADEGIDAEEEAQHDEYNPMGLQMWADESSFLRALVSGRLLLVILLAPWCNRGNMNAGIRNAASLAAQRLDDTFSSMTSSDATFPPVTKPLIGILDASAMEGLIESFGSVTQFPAFKFVLTRGEDEGEDEDDRDVQLWDFLAPRETAKDLYNSVLTYWYRLVVSDALGGNLESNGDGEDNAPVFTFSSKLQLTAFVDRHGDNLFRPAQARRRHQSKLESEVFDFYLGQMDERSEFGGVFQPFEFLSEVDSTSSSLCKAPEKDGDEESASLGHCDENVGFFVQEVDPYLLIVQCRSKIVDYGKVDLEGDKTLTADQVKQIVRLDMEQRARKDFDDLAESMVHRRDVAFLALNATIHNEETPDHSRKICDGLFEGMEGNANGAAAFFRARRYLTYSLDAPAEGYINEQNHKIWEQHRRRVIRNVKTDWDDVTQLHPHAIFVPNAEVTILAREKETHGKGAVKDPTIPSEYVQSNLVASTVVHTTPTVIWFDRDRMAQLAFPWYRKIHAVLFVDMALVHKIWQPNSSQTSSKTWPSSLNRSSETSQLLVTQRRAIQMFYNAALRHRVERPNDDVVFLIVPSSEVRIMTAFGVDIWTSLDEALFGAAYEDGSNGDKEADQSSNTEEGYCSASENGESRDLLPVMMITDSSGRSGMQSSRYYLCSKDIFPTSPVKFNDGGAMGEFIDKFFAGTIGRPFIRSETPLSTAEATSVHDTKEPNINNPNVTILTGNTFEPLVMDRSDVHTMLMIQSTACGHCKRFSIFWNELASLVKALNWSSVVHVMKIDVSKNDVPHDKISVWDLPSVYYFPAGEKKDPIEMTPIERVTSNSQYDYDEGLSWVTSGYDVVKWMLNQGKLDLDVLMRLDSQNG